MGFNGPTLSVFTCPECRKRRLHRPADHVVSDETKVTEAVDGTKITHFIDICGFCVHKLTERVNKPAKKQLRQVLKALHDPETSDLGDKSLEDLL